MQIGALLEDLTVAKGAAGIEKLVRLTPQTARVVRGQAESIIPAEQVAVGDTLRVLRARPCPWTASSARARPPSIRPS